MSAKPLDTTSLSGDRFVAEPNAVNQDRVLRSQTFAPTAAGVGNLLAHPLTAEWDALARRAARVPFSHPQWTLAWWRAFAEPGDQLVLWHVRSSRSSGSRLVALLPVVYRGNTLRLALNYHTPQAELLAENDAVAATLLRALLRDGMRHGAASQAIFPALDPLSSSPGLCLRVARETGHRTLALPHERACYIPLDHGWAAYEAQLGKDVNADVRRRRRRLQELGRLVVDINDGRQNLATLFDTAIAVEGSGWKLRNGTAILSDPRVERFYSDIAHWAAAEDLLRLCFLRVDGKALAMLFVLQHKGTWHLLKCGYDEKFSQASPGKVLTYDLIRHCFDNGMTRIELHGDNEPHKLRWNPQWRELQRLHLFAPSLRGHYAWTRTALRPWLKTCAARLNLLPNETAQ